MGVKVWGKGLGVKVGVKVVVKFGGQGGGHDQWSQGRGVKVWGQGLGSDGRSGLVGGRLEIENGSFKKLMIKFHLIPFQSNPFHFNPFHSIPCFTQCRLKETADCILFLKSLSNYIKYFIVGCLKT